jgi:hypothetical protein
MKVPNLLNAWTVALDWLRRAAAEFRARLREADDAFFGRH